MSKPTTHENRKFIFNVASLVSQAMNQGAKVYEIRFSPDLIRKFEKEFYARHQPPRGKDGRPFLRLDNGVPSIPFLADRELKPGTVLLILDKDPKGGTPVTEAQLILPPGMAKLDTPAIVHERVIKDAATGAMRKDAGKKSIVDKIKGFFK